MKLTIKHKITKEIIKEIEYEKTSNIDLRGADLIGAYLGEADLREANLSGAKIKLEQKKNIIESLGLKIIANDISPNWNVDKQLGFVKGKGMEHAQNL